MMLFCYNLFMINCNNVDEDSMRTRLLSKS